MNDPKRPEYFEKFLNGVDERLDTVHKRSGFSPPHCESCGKKAEEYFSVPGFTVCESCVRPWERERLRKKMR